MKQRTVYSDKRLLRREQVEAMGGDLVVESEMVARVAREVHKDRRKWTSWPRVERRETAVGDLPVLEYYLQVDAEDR